MDYLDVVVHVFTPETREYYRLEQLWGEAPARAVGAARRYGLAAQHDALTPSHVPLRADRLAELRRDFLLAAHHAGQLDRAVGRADAEAPGDRGHVAGDEQVGAL